MTTLDEQLGRDWPSHPEQSPVYWRGILAFDEQPAAPPFDVTWEWRWRRCDGATVTANERPQGVVCVQVGACVVHDPVGVAVPW